jgi:hypothetical protein
VVGVEEWAEIRRLHFVRVQGRNSAPDAVPSVVAADCAGQESFAGDAAIDTPGLPNRAGEGASRSRWRRRSFAFPTTASSLVP